MKTLLLFSSIAFYSLNSSAQITINAQDMETSIGASITYYTDSSSNLTPYHSGANQTWDFSSISNTSSLIYSYGNPASLPGAGYYPSATFGISNNYDNGSVFYSDSPSVRSLWGYYEAGNVRLTYTDAAEELRFPFTFGDSYVDQFSGEVEDYQNSITVPISGSISVEVDGYGSITMPYGVINNVLRIKEIRTSTVTYMGQTSSNTDTTYLWFDGSTPTHIASFTSSSSNGNATAGIIDQNSLGAATQISINKEETISLYPNPTTDFIYINHSNNEALTFSVFNINGQKILTQQNVNMLDLSDFTKGMYFIEVKTLEGKITRKRIVKL